jgi:Arc/MetJ-type ribon-helix-helix transcriptional regulator
LDPVGESVQVSVRLTRAQLAALDRARGEVSRSEFIRRLVGDLEW